MAKFKLVMGVGLLALIGMVSVASACGGIGRHKDGGSAKSVNLPKPTEKRRVAPTDAAKQAAANSNAFGFKVFAEVLKGHESENVVVSGTSLAILLAMLHEGASGESQRVLAEALGHSNADAASAATAYGDLHKTLNGVGEATLLSANAMFLSKYEAFEKPFLDVATGRFDAGIFFRDLGDQAAVTELNEWCSQRTDGMIPVMFEQLPSDSFAVLLNALYFKGEWQQGFDPEKTELRTFWPEAGEPFEVTTMYSKVEARVWHDDRVGVVRIPYKGGDYSMVLVMPTKPKQSLSTVREHLSLGHWAKWWKHIEGKTEAWNVLLPKFKLTERHKLTGTLAKLGLGAALDSADYSRMVKHATGVGAEVEQRVVIEVDEQGTKAAAVTGGPTFFGEPVYEFLPEFKRPFLFAILDHRTGAILFLGQVMDPRKN